MPVSPDTRAIVAALEHLAKEISKMRVECMKITTSLELMNNALNKKDDGDDSSPV